MTFLKGESNMFINNGFTFLNQYGHYTDISPYNNKKDGYIYKERDLGAIDVYAQEKANETTVLLDFASLDPNNSSDIVNFTNKYGFLHCELIDRNNDYLHFNGIDKESFSKFLSVNSKSYECISLDDYKYWIYRFSKILLLQRYVEEINIFEMINICFYFLFIQKPSFHFLCDDIDDWTSSTETESFEESFFKFIDYKEIDNLPKLEQIHLFFDDVKAELNEYLESENLGHYYYLDYPILQSALWKSVITLFEYIDAECEIEAVTNDKIILKNDAKLINTLPENIKALVLTISKSIIIDLVNSGLETIRPFIKLENNSFVGDWAVDSLLDLMNFELFLLLSQDSITKRCPCCGNFFEVTKTNSRKKYCSRLCSMRMAKRQQRKREKKIGYDS